MNNDFITNYLEDAVNKEEAIINVLEFLDELQEDEEHGIWLAKSTVGDYIISNNICPECYKCLTSKIKKEHIEDFYEQSIVIYYCEYCGYSNEIY